MQVFYTFLCFVAFASSASAEQIAYIYGDVAANGNIPSGSQAPYDQMLITDEGATGLSQFRSLVESQGHNISQYYDANTELTSNFLNQFDVVIFGLHQKRWSAAEKNALDVWIRGGGGMLTYSDSASGGRFNLVGAQNPVGQRTVNNLISQYGMQVTVDQAHGVKAVRPGPDNNHPIVEGRLIIEGEGVSPVAVDRNAGVQILIPYEDQDRVSGALTLPHRQNITINNPLFATLALRPLDQGNIIVMFDRQPMWNAGPGSSINRRDNREILTRTINFLASDTNQTPPPEPGLEVSARAEMVVTESGTATLDGTLDSGNANSFAWRKVSGPGSANFTSASEIDTTVTFSEPGLYVLELRAQNNSTSAVAEVPINVVPNANIIYAINAGGGQETSVTGLNYSADAFFTGGNIDNFSGASVAGTQDDEIYNHGRSQHSAYRLPVENGDYLVLLQLSETFFTQANRRVFDVSIEGALLIDDLDLFATAPGRHTAYDLLLDTTVSDGVLDITFSASVNNSLLNALVVIAKGNRNTPPDPGPEVQDNIVNDGISTSLVAANPIIVIVPYSASTNRDVVAELWSDNGGGFLGIGRVDNVAPGSGTATISVNLNTTPAVGNNYQIRAALRPRGSQRWQDNIDPTTVNNVAVTDTTPDPDPDPAPQPDVQDNIVNDGISTSLISANPIIVSVPYSASTNRDVVAELWGDGGTRFLGIGRVNNVATGSGTADINVNLNSAPAAGNNYQIRAALRPRGSQRWQDNIDPTLVNNVIVTDTAQPDPDPIPDPPVDQCDTTAQCRVMFGDTATDCLNSQSEQSICICGDSPCTDSPIPDPTPGSGTLGNFDKSRDLFLAFFDNRPDADDIHSQAGVATLLQDSRFDGVNFYSVLGTYGRQNSVFLNSSTVMNLCFGSANWTNAHPKDGPNWTASLDRVQNRVQGTLNAGGDVWIMEAGQSDFTADLVRRLNSSSPNINTQDRIHVVQHSDFNENQTTPQDFSFVRANTDYIRIPDGNGIDNGSPQFNTRNGSRWSTAESIPGVGSCWTEARRVANAENFAGPGRFVNPSIAAGGFDFSDVSEATWIFGFNSLRNHDNFFNEFPQ